MIIDNTGYKNVIIVSFHGTVLCQWLLFFSEVPWSGFYCIVVKPPSRCFYFLSLQCLWHVIINNLTTIYEDDQAGIVYIPYLLHPLRKKQDTYIEKLSPFWLLFKKLIYYNILLKIFYGLLHIFNFLEEIKNMK